jgi:lipoprotein-anchoring transpeptidase ErfK/SrfK
MNIAKSWSLRGSIIALMLGAAPASSTTANQPAEATGVPAAAQPAPAAPAPLAAPPVAAPQVAPAPVAAPQPAAAVPAPVAAPAATPRPAPVVAPEPAPPLAARGSLAPGEFVWQPERSAAGPVEIVVSIPAQLAYVYRGGTLIGVTTVSTGRPGHSTPTGRFEILQKRQVHHSSLYNNAPMPFMQRLTWSGIAMHAGRLPGHPASHGCIRMPLAFARNLFGVTQLGGRVHVVNGARTAQAAQALVRGGWFAQSDADGAARVRRARGASHTRVASAGVATTAIATAQATR